MVSEKHLCLKFTSPVRTVIMLDLSKPSSRKEKRRKQQFLYSVSSHTVLYYAWRMEKPFKVRMW